MIFRLRFMRNFSKKCMNSGPNKLYKFNKGVWDQEFASIGMILYKTKIKLKEPGQSVTIILWYIRKDQGQESIFTLWECAQSISRIKLPPVGFFVKRNFFPRCGSKFIIFKIFNYVITSVSIPTFLVKWRAVHSYSGGGRTHMCFKVHKVWFFQVF
jgi:hypothetical protein